MVLQQILCVQQDCFCWCKKWLYPSVLDCVCVCGPRSPLLSLSPWECVFTGCLCWGDLGWIQSGASLGISCQMKHWGTTERHKKRKGCVCVSVCVYVSMCVCFGVRESNPDQQYPTCAFFFFVQKFPHVSVPCDGTYACIHMFVWVFFFFFIFHFSFLLYKHTSVLLCALAWVYFMCACVVWQRKH